MNDPHVVALLYSVNHDTSVDYSQAKPLIHEESAFRLEVKDNQARFEMKEHYATGEEARYAIENFIRNWESHASLERGPDSFHLEFERAEIKDRNPIPDKTSLRATVSLGALKASCSLSVVVPNYPKPSPRVNFNDPDVQTIHQRYMGYRRDNEPLAGMAYFCLTFLESLSGQNNNRRKAAAHIYQIDKAVLNKIGELSSKKGGQGARKAVGANNDFTNQECTFLEQALKRIIRRVAEKAHSPNNAFQKITMSEFPEI